MQKIIYGNNIEALQGLADNSVDSVVTDSPYGLGKEPDPKAVLRDWLDHGYHELKAKAGFMGKEWDAFVPQPALWREVFRVLKPGGYLLSFFGTRTYDWGTLAIRLAGFEIRDCIQWVYGCLSEDTEILTEDGFMSYEQIRKSNNSRILTYDVNADTYCLEKPSAWSEYSVTDTCYRIQSADTDQIVSRNHRVLIEREGALLFELAEDAAREQQIRVPTLESLHSLRGAVSDTYEGASLSEQDLQQILLKCSGIEVEQSPAPGMSEDHSDKLRRLREGNDQTGILAEAGQNSDVQQTMQRDASGAGLGRTRSQGAAGVVGGAGSCAQSTDDGRDKPLLERGYHLPEQKRLLRESLSKVREVPSASEPDGSEGRVCIGVPDAGVYADRQTADPGRSSAPQRSQSGKQSSGQPDALCNESGAQALRSGPSYHSSLATITPFLYRGLIFCPTVSTGAFVARRNGKIFLTGNSGFPKSLDVSKAIDSRGGARREIIGTQSGNLLAVAPGQDNDRSAVTLDITAPATDEAKQWQGWGTALKPANEPICVARKPLIGTVAENVLQYGTGAINIDGCRVGTDEKWAPSGEQSGGTSVTCYGNGLQKSGRSGGHDGGRWPANVIHDGSDEVVALFPANAGAAAAAVKGTEPSEASTGNVTGKRARVAGAFHSDSGSAARFFYCAKASKADRGEGNDHPTVKPTALMAYLVRLVTPPGGVCLDPHYGSGSTGVACEQEGISCIGLERDAPSVRIAAGRVPGAEIVVDGVSLDAELFGILY